MTANEVLSGREHKIICAGCGLRLTLRGTDKDIKRELASLHWYIINKHYICPNCDVTIS